MQWIVKLWNKSAEVFHSSVENIKSIAQPIIELICSEPVTQSTKYITTQLAEGFKTIITFPLTVISMPFHPQARQLVKDTLQYNFLYYALPVIGYYGVAREPVSAALKNVVGDYIFVVDMAMNVAFFRSATNAYFYNTFNNVNATMIKLNEDAPDGLLTECDCEGSKHIRGTLMSPIYYMGKTLSASALSNLPYVGFVFKYWFKPLSLGECLAEDKLVNLCNEHRQNYFARHTMSNFGIGIAAMISLKGATYLVGSMTGVTSLWLDDAMFNLLFPLMFFHIHNQPMPAHIEPGPHLDFFYPIREGINKTIEKTTRVILPRIMNAENDGQVLEYMKGAWSSLPIKTTRKVLLYPQVNNGIESIVGAGPVNLLMRINHDIGKDIISKLRSLLDYEQYVKLYINCYNWMPFVAPMSHQKFIVKILTNDPKQTRWLINKLDSLLDHAKQPDRHHTKVTWLRGRNNLKDLNLQQSYYQHSRQGPSEAPLNDHKSLNTVVPLDEDQFMKLGGTPPANKKIIDDWVRLSPRQRQRPPPPPFNPGLPQSILNKEQVELRHRKKPEAKNEPRVNKMGFTFIEDYDSSKRHMKK